MRRIWIPALLALALVSCADAPRGPGSGTTSPSPSPEGPSRVDLVEAGLREVLPRHVDGVLLIRSELCTTGFTREEPAEECGEPLTEEEQADLEARLAPIGEVRFYSDYEDIPEGEAPIDGARAVFAWTSEPVLQADGTYHVEAGETCGGLCGHGGTYVLEEVDGRWRSTGPVPGSGQWIS